MTTYSYSDTYPDDQIEFDPGADVLLVHEGSASEFLLTPREDGSGTDIARSGESGLGLMGVGPGSLNSTNVVFDDGSLLVNASLDNLFSSLLTGSANNDLLLGSFGIARQEIATALDTPRNGTYATGGTFSADARYVAFISNDPNLDGNPPNQDGRNMYLKDLLTGQVTQVSSTSSGTPGNQATVAGAISGDGRFVAFESFASNLANGDTNGELDVYLKNVATGEVTRVSTRTGGNPGPDNPGAHGASVSYDGRYVMFSSAASDLMAGDTNEASDVFVKDMLTGELQRVSTDSNGVQGNAESGGVLGAKISADGTHVIFASRSNNFAGDADALTDVFVKNLQTGELVNVTGDSGMSWSGAAKVGDISADGRYVVFQTGERMLDDDWNGSESIYWKDLQTGETVRVCVGFGGTEQSMAISADGRYVVFSTSRPLTGADTNLYSDVYVMDMKTGDLALVSQTAAGKLGNDASLEAEISLDGSSIVFATYASNLVAGDTNGTLSTIALGNPLYARTLSGGAGDDAYIVSNASDVVVEGVSGGTDTVRSSVTHQLSSNVENLELTGHAAINGTGNALNNLLTGNDSANVLDGGTGADTMSGGAGNDTYVVERAGDVITEAPGMGIDTVRSSISLVLQADLDNLVLTGTADLTGAGNTLANSLTGNSGANSLDGGAGNDTLNGAAGADTLTGGSGDDTYVLADAADTIVETAGGGNDSVQAAFSLVLQPQLENLTLTGSASINATGNTLANRLVGNQGANVLDAGAGNDTLDGGVGADTMNGGTGDDTYFVDSTSDRLVEAGGAGTDSVNSSVSFTLATDFERLTLIGEANINGTGNAQANVIDGNAGENRLDGGAGADTLSGGAGNDVYVLDNAGDVVVESDAWNGGYDWISSSVSVVMQAQVEDVVLVGSAAIDATGNALANSMAGNSASNVLRGDAGNDTLQGGYGGEAADTLVGGTGDDEYHITNSWDQVVELAGEGTDTVYSYADFVLQAEIESLELLASDDIDATGNALANTLRGNLGSNVLDGAAGADTMIGAEGNDTYVVDNLGDVTDESGGNGIDTVRSSISLTLQGGIEKLVLTGTAALNGTGNSLANTLTGNSAANLLNGATGADTMSGGAGNDTYLVDNGGDQAIEAAGGGVDLVQSSVSFTLQAEVDNLKLTGSAAINGTGNELANLLEGNSAGNALDGAGGNDTLDGGAGADTLTGGGGNDTYVVDDAADRVVEVAAGGVDLVRTSLSYQLLSEVDNLTLLGTSAISGTGNALNNLITGNAGANVLGGGAGADTMMGGAGDDSYVVDNAGDQVVESAGGGTDAVRSAVSFQLQAEVEQLTMTGTSAINGTGNSLANTITGNSAANVLDGGAGVDTLTGGAGNDTYVVDDAGDKTIEVAGGGTDLVRSSISLTLQSEVENLTLTGSATINATGNSLVNTITGNGAANVLSGGAGADLLIGGAGNDTYIVDNVADRAIEVAGGGNDLIKSFITFQLPSEVESLTLLGASAINGTGNALANVITGNAAANVLGGGAGADTLTGGSGNDTYVVDNAGDKTVELAGGGVDLTRSFIGFVLQAEVENLDLLGTEAINGAGNSLANTLKGNSAANVLTGGAGADTLTGGAGSDTFTLNSTLGSDLITDFAHASDKLRITQSMLRVGDGDTVIEGGVSVAGPNGFASGAELVIVTHDISGGITATSAAAAIGHADSAYAVGDTRLFVVDNGSDSAVYLFKAANADSTISASELTLLATLDNAANTTVTDYLFGA